MEGHVAVLSGCPIPHSVGGGGRGGGGGGGALWKVLLLFCQAALYLIS